MHTHFCVFAADFYAQSVLGNKISASELSRKFIKSALLVGCGCPATKHQSLASLGCITITHLSTYLGRWHKEFLFK